LKAQSLPANDFPPTETRTSYAITGAARSGSSLLCHLLQQTGRMGFPMDYFLVDNLDDWRERAGAADLDEVIAFMKARRTSPNGVFGFKCFLDRLEYLGARVERHFPGLRFVHLTRRDLLAQAISLTRAEQTQAWNSSMPAASAPRFDASEVERRLDAILVESATWDKLFALHGIEPIRVEYEALCADPQAVVRGIAEELGVDLAGVTVDVARVPIGVQSDATNAAWRDAIRARGLDVAAARLRVPSARTPAVRRGLETVDALARRIEARVERWRRS
jgi:LPS sulfotransferase NodH